MWSSVKEACRYFRYMKTAIPVMKVQDYMPCKYTDPNFTTAFTASQYFLQS